MQEISQIWEGAWGIEHRAKGQRTDGRRQMTEVRGRRSEDGRQLGTRCCALGTLQFGISNCEFGIANWVF
jgi:hypothetical protein